MNNPDQEYRQAVEAVRRSLSCLEAMRAGMEDYEQRLRRFRAHLTSDDWQALADGMAQDTDRLRRRHRRLHHELAAARSAVGDTLSLG